MVKHQSHDRELTYREQYTLALVNQDHSGVHPDLRIIKILSLTVINIRYSIHRKQTQIKTSRSSINKFE